MKIQIFLKVKFRAFGVTFGQLENQWEEIIPGVFSPPESKVIIDFNDRGVKLFVKLVSVS